MYAVSRVDGGIRMKTSKSYLYREGKISVHLDLCPRCDTSHWTDQRCNQ